MQIHLCFEILLVKYFYKGMGNSKCGQPYMEIRILSGGFKTEACQMPDLFTHNK